MKREELDASMTVVYKRLAFAWWLRRATWSLNHIFVRSKTLVELKASCFGESKE
jgi:hypothetical protein